MLSTTFYPQRTFCKRVAILLIFFLLLQWLPLETRFYSSIFKVAKAQMHLTFNDSGLLQPELNFYFIYDIDNVSMTNPMEGQPIHPFFVSDTAMFQATIALRIMEAGKPVSNASLSLNAWNTKFDTTFNKFTNDDGYALFVLTGRSVSEGYRYQAYLTENPYVETEVRKIEFADSYSSVIERNKAIELNKISLLVDENGLPQYIRPIFTIRSLCLVPKFENLKNQE